jgi:hypothetical protein
MAGRLTSCESAREGHRELGANLAKIGQGWHTSEPKDTRQGSWSTRHGDPGQALHDQALHLL